MSGLTLEQDGAVRLERAALSILADLRDFAEGLPQDRVGQRLHGMKFLQAILAPNGVLGALATERLGPQARAVRALLFDKSPANNWSLGWHRDRTIVVRRRIEVSGFGPWTIKQGMAHVALPAALQAGCGRWAFTSTMYRTTMRHYWSRGVPTALGGSPRPGSTTWSSVAAPQPVSPTRAIYGFMRPRSRTHRRHRRGYSIGASCRSISPPSLWPADWNGSASDRCNRRRCSALKVRGDRHARPAQQTRRGLRR